MSTRASTLTLLLVTAIAGGGCDYLPFGYTPIKEITAAPGQFEGKEVRLKGKATGTMNLLGFKAYVLRDDTGEIPVVTPAGLPAENSEVAIKGVVNHRTLAELTVSAITPTTTLTTK